MHLAVIKLKTAAETLCRIYNYACAGYAGIGEVVQARELIRPRGINRHFISLNVFYVKSESSFQSRFIRFLLLSCNFLPFPRNLLGDYSLPPAYKYFTFLITTGNVAQSGRRSLIKFGKKYRAD